MIVKFWKQFPYFLTVHSEYAKSIDKSIIYVGKYVIKN